MGKKTTFPVLILVLMEDTLGEIQEEIEKKHQGSLNPCFNGRYSRSFRNLRH